MNWKMPELDILLVRRIMAKKAAQNAAPKPGFRYIRLLPGPKHCSVQHNY
jgi:hypothetical protein